MKRFRMIRGILCLAAALLAAVPAGGAEGAFEIADEGLELTETVSIYYPVVTGGGDEALRTQINDLIRERCRVGDYLSRAARLLSGGSLRADWRGGAEGDVLSVAVSAEGAVETARNTHVWTAVTVDLRDGREIPLTDLFSDGEAAREKIKAYLEEAVAPELSAHLQNSELTPLPELFLLERTGLTLLYPVEQLSTLTYNQYAPVLMTSVDTDPKLCAEERRAIMQRLGAGRWQVFGAHGMKKDYQVQAQ